MGAPRRTARLDLGGGAVSDHVEPRPLVQVLRGGNLQRSIEQGHEIARYLHDIGSLRGEVDAENALLGFLLLLRHCPSSRPRRRVLARRWRGRKLSWSGWIRAIRIRASKLPSITSRPLDQRLGRSDVTSALRRSTANAQRSGYSGELRCPGA